MDKFINFNGHLLPEDQPVFKASSRAARFGDAVFETMRMKEGKVLFADLHGARLFHGLGLLQFRLPPSFNWKFLQEEIEKLTTKNACIEQSRVRLMVTRGEGGITDEPENSPQFLIECWPAENYVFNKEGLRIDIFEDSRKSMDKYSSIKSSNFLPSVMASLFAKKNGLDECVFLNQQGRICDATISNVFWISKGKVFTPHIEEGGIAGVMRHHLLERLPRLGYSVSETTCSIAEIMKAEEIFLTNIIRGIRWVKVFRDVELSNLTTSVIYKEVLSPFL